MEDLILDHLVKHPEQLRCLWPDTVETRSLQFLTPERRSLVDAHTGVLQSLIHWLKQVFPQMIRWFDDLGAPLVRDLLLRWPTLQELQKARPKTLLRFFYRAQLPKYGADPGAFGRNSPGRPRYPRSSSVAGRHPIHSERGPHPGQHAARDRRVRPPDRGHLCRPSGPLITESLPGAGPVLEPRLLAAAGTLRDRFASAHNMACCFGIAPVTEASGNALRIHAPSAASACAIASPRPLLAPVITAVRPASLRFTASSSRAVCSS